ncbi:MAG TPA: diguanylate cyclase domain-containing protein [Candidatus Brocadiia bacterium]|nr:diguanylate cyclase [Candidatus Brocadiales bacterium]
MMCEENHINKTHDEPDQKYRSLMYYASDAIFLTDTEGNLLEVNKKAEELTGYTQKELVNMNFTQLHPKEELKRVTTAFKVGIEKGSGSISDMLILRKDGNTVPVDLTGSVIEYAGKRVSQVIVRDIAGRKLVEQRLGVQYAITRILTESTSIDEATLKILQTMCEGLGWDLGALWTAGKKNELRCIEIWHSPSVKVAEFEAISRKTTFPPGVGLPGRVWAYAKPVWISDVVHDTNFQRAAIAAKEGLHSAFAFPIMGSSKFLGAVEFFSREIEQPDEDLLYLMIVSGSQIGQFIERKQAEEALKHRMDFEKTIASISTRFVRLSDFNTAVSASLADIGRMSGASRAYLFQFRDDDKIMDNTHEWCNDGVAPEIQNLQNLHTSMVQWWMTNLYAGNVIEITDVSKLPPEAAAEKEILQDQDIKSLLALPVSIDKKLIGFIGFDNVMSTGTWHEDDLALLRIAAEIIGNAIARKQSEATIRHMAYHDALTNLPNRMLFEDRLRMALIHAKRNKLVVGVFFLDLDNLKTINDSFGHHMGDLLIKAVAERLKRLMREGDTVARMGGDEFMVILPDLTHAQDAAVIAQKILDVLYQPFILDGNETHTTASIGIGVYPMDGGDVDSLTKYADIAMYHSKESGKNTYRFYRTDMNTHVQIEK